ncbi:MAG: hypothetical protein K8T20_08130, partial [Planctomycetes bacterium]|nr:hypothetical protein [Planctomycetota bacterium]
ESALRSGKAIESRAAFHVALEYLGRRWPDTALVGRVYTGLADVHILNKDRDAALRNFARAFKTLRDAELALPFALARASWAALLAEFPGSKEEAREAAEIAAEAATTLQGAGAKAAEARARDAAERLRKFAE